MNETTRMLQAYLDGELPDDQRAEVQRRLAADPGCRRELAALQAIWQVVDTAAPTEVGSVWPRVAASLKSRRRSSAWTLPQRGLAAAALVAGLLVGYGVGNRPVSQGGELADVTSVDSLEDTITTLDSLWLELSATEEEAGS